MAARIPSIHIRGARQHNLQGVDADIPLRRMTVITGVSGSGKSSLAFHTLYAEGQRRYVETFSAYARQFLDRMDRPDVDRIENILPAVAIERSRTPRGSRSTVATLCQLLDHCKLLWAKVASLTCLGCGRDVERDAPGSIADTIAAWPKGTKYIVGFELALSHKDAVAGGIADLRAAGLFRILRKGKAEDIAEDGSNWPRRGEVALVVDRLIVGRTARSRVVDSLETAFRAGRDRLFVQRLDVSGEKARERYSAGLRCAHCGTGHRTPIPNLFSFNSPLGACETCSGFGRVTGIDWDLVVPLAARSLRKNAIRPFEMPSARRFRSKMIAWCREVGIDVDTPWEDLPADDRTRVLHGDGEWMGVAGWFKQLQRKIYKVHVRVLLSRFRGYPKCMDCDGSRLGPEGRAWRVLGRTLPEVLAMDVRTAYAFFQQDGSSEALARVPAQGREVVRLLFDEIRTRLQCLEDVGLSYLTLDRAARTLSGGEVQRVNLTAALGTHLVNTMFVLDEPSVGLHPRDNDRLVALLRRICDQGNTVVVVEHDPAILKEADHVIDMGPGAGELGGHVVASGTPAQLKRNTESVTGRWLAGRNAMPERRATHPSGKFVGVRGASANNLQNVDLTVELGAMTVLAGVSGSGKSSLAHDTIYLAMARALGRPENTPGSFDVVVGADLLSDVVLLDQSASGQTSRANAATYVDAWTGIRTLYGTSEEALTAGFGACTFSFNVDGGRCPRCKGEGRERVEMQFLSDVNIVCPDCDGTRFRPEVREIRWHEKSIADVLQLTASEALPFFEDAPDRLRKKIVPKLKPLVDVGLGYLRLGQPLSTMSSGEWQRLRLAAALTERVGKKPRLYIFDEPTTGLHLDDVATLARALHRLADRGHGVLVVEHQVDLMWTADRVVELGPVGGPAGGHIVADGTPEIVAAGDSPTAFFLREAAAGRAVETPRRRTPATPPSHVEIRGARHHNLRDLDVDVPRDQFVVISGPSGSGKSTLAFDLLFAEGQRRYIDTLSAYARQFVGQLARPDVDSVRGIPPTVAIEQRRTRGGNRSTMATATEVSHFLRLLFARAGTPHCPTCERPLAAMSGDAVFDRILQDFAGRDVSLLAPRVLGRKGFHKTVFAAMVRKGLTHARVDGVTVPLDPEPQLDRYREHDVEAVVASMRVERKSRARLREAVDDGLAYGDGMLGVFDGVTVQWLSTTRTCPSHGTTVPALDPRMFSHNSHRGWCPGCRGLGTQPRVNADALPQNPDGTLSKGALSVLRVDRSLRKTFLRDVRSTYGITANTKWGSIKPEVQHALIHGRRKDAFVGVAERLEGLLAGASDIAVDWFGPYVDRQPCKTCDGSRLRPESRAVRIGGVHTLPHLLGLSVDAFLVQLDKINLSSREAQIAAPILSELRERAALLQRMGLGYLSFDRAATTLSGGESQRIRLAAQLGSNLRGACYVLDEPTIGLHPTDNDRLLDALIALRERGNSLIVVEHDLETVRRADHVIDMGPGGGREGGNIVAMGTPAELAEIGTSPTGRVLARAGRVAPYKPRTPKEWIRVQGATCHNLNGVDAAFPLACLTAVTGVSGAGKTSLVQGELVPGVRAHLNEEQHLSTTQLTGVASIERLVEVDAAPVGKTPRSVPATYLGIWTEMRKVLSLTQEARARGYGPGRFSFNVKAGRCPACDGRGEIIVEMSFLPNVRVPCERCDGARFGPETLEITWKGRSAADLLALTFEDAVDVFADVPKIAPAVRRMVEVGLGYLTLGQPTPTLSGGEAQRLKLVTELGRGGAAGTTLYVLDEPTIGLHEEDVDRLLAALHRLVERGDTVIVIEHDSGFVARCDHVIDLGPGAGSAGGHIVTSGTPRSVTRSSKSATGRALRSVLRKAAG